MSNHFPKTTRDLTPSERRFVSAMQQLGHGRFESVRISRGELVLDPWPTSVRNVKFGVIPSNRPNREKSSDFDLKKHLVDFFAFVRGVESGEIRTLHVFDGSPVDMDIEQAPQDLRGSCDANI